MNYPFYGAASITASKRSQIINLDNSHGPAMYDISKQKINTYSPKWTLKPKLQHNSCFKQNKSPPPPPGAYQVSGNMKDKVTLQNPNYRSQKHPKSSEKQSHMSDINIPSSINANKGSSFGYRDQMPLFKPVQYSPGPIYHPLKNIQEERSTKIKNSGRGFGFGQRNAIYKSTDTVPGPGAYFEKQKESSFKLNHSATYSTFGRSQRNVVSNTVPLGPGEYCPQISNNGSFLLNPSGGIKLKGKLPQQQKYINPTGPGTYDLPDKKSNIGPRFNHQRHKSQANQSSSPFAYDCPRYPENIDDRKGYSLGKKIQNLGSKGQNIPGPGSYHADQNLAITKRGGYMGRKTLKKKKTPLDECFGKYDPNYNAASRTGPQFKFSCQQKQCTKVETDNNLGPGQYEIKEKVSGESYSMGTSQRFKQLKKQRGFVNHQKLMMSSTIGYLPSYLKKKSELSMSMSKLQVMKEKESQQS